MEGQKGILTLQEPAVLSFGEITLLQVSHWTPRVELRNEAHLRMLRELHGMWLNQSKSTKKKHIIYQEKEKTRGNKWYFQVSTTNNIDLGLKSSLKDPDQVLCVPGLSTQHFYCPFLRIPVKKYGDEILLL